jgi:hypothetical protein
MGRTSSLDPCFLLVYVGYPKYFYTLYEFTTSYNNNIGTCIRL